MRKRRRFSAVPLTHYFCLFDNNNNNNVIIIAINNVHAHTQAHTPILWPVSRTPDIGNEFWELILEFHLTGRITNEDLSI